METMNIPAGSGRQLAALYHPPTSADRGRAVLILNPLGQEAVRAHRLLRVLADRWAGRLRHVLPAGAMHGWPCSLKGRPLIG